MASAQSNPEYLNYYDYINFKDKFNPTWVTTFNKEKFENILNNTLENDVRSKYYDVLKEIFRHIYNYNVFTRFGATKPCIYVSYILHKVVKNKKGMQYNEDTFNTTKKFVEKFKKEESYSNEGCESKMVYIDSNTYEKMKYLYDLYDNYYEYTNKNYWADYADKCKTIGLAMHYHNKIIDDYQSDDDLVKKSLDMKLLIEKLELQPSHECNYKIRELKKSNLELEREREKEKLKVHTTGEGQKLPLRPQDAFSSQVTALENEVLNAKESESGHPEQQKHVEEPLPARELSTHDRLIDSNRSNVNQQPGHHQQSELNHESERYQTFDYNQVSQTYNSRGNSFNSPREVSFISLGDNQQLSKDVQTLGPEEKGFFSNVSDTITGFIREVEPAPVLGVSGGMGVLFLLFKV
ncbi:variable surface protein Vir6-related, partial [Plasmodium vivax]